MKNLMLLFRQVSVGVIYMVFANQLIAQSNAQDLRIQERLRVYYVVNPNEDTQPHSVDVSSEGNLFGGNPQMEVAQQLVRAIFSQGENAEYQEAITNILREYDRPVALFLYNDEDQLDEAVAAENWNNCLASGHFTSCVTVEENDEYAGILHYGSTQMNSDGIDAVKTRITDLLREISRTTFDIPLGKGMFVENLRGAEPTAAGFAQRASQNGISWIAFKGATQDTEGITRNDKNQSQRIVAEYIQAFRSQVNNAKVYIWGWPTANSNRSQYRRFIDLLIQKAEWVEADGIMLDIEGPIHRVEETGWNRGNTTPKMRILMDYALSEAHQRGMSVSVSSFGTAVQRFPWSQMRRADFGVPQLYSPENRIFDESGNVLADHRNYVQRGIRLWQDETRGFNNRIVVASATMTGARKTATHVSNLLEITAPHLTNQSIIWWVWHGTENRRNPMSEAKWDIIKDFNFNTVEASN